MHVGSDGETQWYYCSLKILHDFKDGIIFPRLFLVGVVCNVAVFIVNLSFCGIVYRRAVEARRPVSRAVN